MLAHSCGVNCGMASRMASQSLGMVRAAALCRMAFNLANAFSIGLKSGEQGGRPQDRDEHLLDIGREGGTVHWPVEHHRCGQAAKPESCDEGNRLAVSVWDRCPASLPAWCSSAEPCHLRRGTGSPTSTRRSPSHSSGPRPASRSPRKADRNRGTSPAGATRFKTH